MADYDISVGKDLLPGLLSGPDGLAKLVEAELNQVLEAQVTESLGAAANQEWDTNRRTAQKTWNGYFR